MVAAHTTPKVVISSVGWNPQESPALATSLDIQDRIRVEFQGQTQDSRIVGMKHDMSSDRWVIDVDLIAS